MNRKNKKLFSLLLAVCLLLTAALPAFAAGASDDPNVFLCKKEGWDEEVFFTDTVLTYDPAAGRLTVAADSNSAPVETESACIAWIKSIAPGVKTVLITKDSNLYSACVDDEGDCRYSSTFWWEAFAYLENLERFEVESGNRDFEVKDGVLYTRRCHDLVHYPAAKPDKTYKVDDWCVYGLYPYAFCNTKYLERLELPYVSVGKITAFAVNDYSFSAVDLDTGAQKTGSIKEITFYGDARNLQYLGSLCEGNNVLEQAEIISRNTDVFHDLSTFIRVEIIMRFQSMLEVFQYLIF